MKDSSQRYEDRTPSEGALLPPAPLELRPGPLVRVAREAEWVAVPERLPAARRWVEVELPVEDSPPAARGWLARGAAVVVLCLVWASALGAATVWPRWNRAQLLRAEIQEHQSQAAAMEARLSAAKLAANKDTSSRARDRVLCQDEVPAFLRALRARAGGLGAKVVALEGSNIDLPPGSSTPASMRGRLVVEGGFPALYSLLDYLESRRVFVAVNRAELAPIAADGRLKAVYEFEYLVVPAAAAGSTGAHA